jgi:tetratricopeptide (TPR) repeat protein
MMQHPVTIASTLLLVISAVAASAADQSVWDQCNQTRDMDASITACTQILQAPGETASDLIEINSQDAEAYVRRGIAYRVQGNSDRAIADYSKAIEINPQDANAYFNRGGAFEAKGDRDRAIPVD